MNALSWIAVTSGLWIAIGCGQSTPTESQNGASHRKEIYRVGTKEYADKITQFRLTLAEAKERVVTHKRQSGLNPDAKVLVGDHQLIVGDEYLFSVPDKMGISLNGYYVNGMTGEVTRRVDQGRIDSAR
jgi:hypothetical protein